MHWISNPTITGDFSPSQFCHVTIVEKEVTSSKIVTPIQPISRTRTETVTLTSNQLEEEDLELHKEVVEATVVVAATQIKKISPAHGSEPLPGHVLVHWAVYTNAKVSNIQVSTMLDTGASISLISNNMLKHLQRRQAQHSNKCSTPNCHC